MRSPQARRAVAAWDAGSASAPFGDLSLQDPPPLTDAATSRDLLTHLGDEDGTSSVEDLLSRLVRESGRRIGLRSSRWPAMIPPMFKLTFASTLVIACLAGCSERTTSSPASDPSDVEFDLDESDSDEAEPVDEFDAESYESDEAEPANEVEQPDLDQTEAAEDAPAEAEEEPPRKACSELPQNTCQITVGCAWSTDKTCVEQ